jgi:copper transport protein
VRLLTTALDMDMGTDTVDFQRNGLGTYSAQGELAMSEHWQIRLQVRTADQKFHEVTVRLDLSV